MDSPEGIQSRRKCILGWLRARRQQTVNMWLWASQRCGLGPFTQAWAKLGYSNGNQGTAGCLPEHFGGNVQLLSGQEEVGENKEKLDGGREKHNSC